MNQIFRSNKTLQILSIVLIILALTKYMIFNVNIVGLIVWLVPIAFILIYSFRRPSKKFYQSIGFIYLIYFMVRSLNVFGVKNPHWIDISEISLIVVIFINSVFIAATKR